MRFSDVMDAMIGRRLGNEILQKRTQALAPSTEAASYSSGAICCSPASRMTVVCGIPTHTPTTITAGNAVLKSPSQLISLGPPKKPSVAFSGPDLGE